MLKNAGRSGTLRATLVSEKGQRTRLEAASLLLAYRRAQKSYDLDALKANWPKHNARRAFLGSRRHGNEYCMQFANALTQGFGRARSKINLPGAQTAAARGAQAMRIA